MRAIRWPYLEETDLSASATESFLPFSRPSLGEEEIAEVVDCLRSGWITTGPRCETLEREFRESVGARHALAVTSGTAALHVTLLALGIGPGDEVIVPPLTWPTTANMVVGVGATPVFADIDPRTWNLAPAAAAAKLSPRTRLLLPVHYAGQPADLDAMREALAAAGRADVGIVEDAAHAAGAAYRGRPIGGCARNGTRAAIFSFHPIKNMTTGEGAVVTTDDDELARRVRLWRFHGVERDAWRAYAGSSRPATTYDVLLPGFKYNLTDIQAAIGIHQRRKLAGLNARREELARAYEARLAGVRGLELLGRAPYEVTHARHLFPVLVPKGARAGFIERMKALGIGTGLHFEALHLTTFYRERLGTREGCCPVAEDVCARVVSLPLYPAMADGDVDRAVAAVEEALRG